MPSSDSNLSDITWLVQRELNLNQEVLLLRTENTERREKLRKMLETETVPDKIGLTRVPFSMKKLPSELLRDQIAHKNAEIREKVKQWQGYKSEIEKKAETYLLASDDSFASACKAFGVIAETRANLANLRNRLSDYLARTGQVRGAMAAGYNTASQTFSKQALDTINEAVKSAYAVDGTILKIQEREAQFNRLVAASCAENTRLTEFYTLSLGDFTESLRVMALAAGQQAVANAVQNCELILSESIPTYEKALSQAEDEIRRACLTQIDSFWQNLRAEVWQQLHQIKPMPQRARMTNGQSQQSDSSQTPPPFQEHERPPASQTFEPNLITQPNEPEKDKGRGLTDDYFIRPTERRSSLKLKTPSNS